jgi:hypothetical protein
MFAFILVIIIAFHRALFVRAERNTLHSSAALMRLSDLFTFAHNRHLASIRAANDSCPEIAESL